MGSWDDPRSSGRKTIGCVQIFGLAALLFAGCSSDEAGDGARPDGGAQPPPTDAHVDPIEEGGPEDASHDVPEADSDPKDVGGQADGTAIIPEDPGMELFSVSERSGVYGWPTSLPGNPASPVAAIHPSRAYVAFLESESGRVAVLGIDSTSHTGPALLNEAFPIPKNASHDAPSVFQDGEGFVYATYYGGSIYAEEGSGADAPFLRRTRYPNDVSEWLPEARARIWNYAELHGMTLPDGSVLIVGSDSRAKIDIIESGGDDISYRWEAARQVISQNSAESGSNPEPGNPSGCKGNRFTKTSFIRGHGADNRIFAVWGWGGGYYDDERPVGYCEDIRHYSADSHEIFAAVSSDGGIHWSNLQGTKTVSSRLCPTAADCGNVSSPSDDAKGIVHNDVAFRLTDMRQGEHRRLWEGADGTVYVAFVKSMWCDSGVCTNKSVTDPGSLHLLIHKPNGEKDLRMIDAKRHFYIPGIRKAGSRLYVWAENRDDSRVVEYVSDDEGATWSGTPILNKSCSRTHGQVHAPNLESVRILLQCSGTPGRDIYYYRRSF